MDAGLRLNREADKEKPHGIRKNKCRTKTQGEGRRGKKRGLKKRGE